MTLSGSPAVHRRFDALCTRVGADGRGLSLADLAAIHALAREEAGAEPDARKVAELRQALGLTDDGRAP